MPSDLKRRQETCHQSPTTNKSSFLEKLHQRYKIYIHYNNRLIIAIVVDKVKPEEVEREDRGDVGDDQPKEQCIRHINNPHGYAPYNILEILIFWDDLQQKKREEGE